jgi:hypothetical protein
MKSKSISVRQRLLLNRLLHRNLRGCSTSALASAERLGWTFGSAGGYELTVEGRRVAEQSELVAARGPLELT